MNTGESKASNVRELAEENYVEAPANSGDCSCPDEHNLHVALSEQHTRPAVFEPDHIGLEGAFCATLGRCKELVKEIAGSG